MNYNDIINSPYSEAAAILKIANDSITLLDLNRNYLSEVWQNVQKKDYIDAFPGKVMDKDNLEKYLKAVKKCAETGEEQIVEVYRTAYPSCCIVDNICIRSRLVLIEKTSEGIFVYESVRNISSELKMKETLSDIEYRYRQTSEQINIYNWEYTIATKEMRPCFRCMRDLGLPPIVYDYPEPVIENGTFPPDYADFYRDMMKKIDEGIPEIEADIPLTVGRIPFRIKYTTTFDENGKPVKSFGSATLISETELGHIKLDNQIIATLAGEYRCLYLVDFVSDKVRIIKQDDLLSAKDNTACEELLVYLDSKLIEATADTKKMLCNVKLFRTELFNNAEKREFVYKDDKSGKWIRIEYQVIERGIQGIDRLLILVSEIDDLRAQKMDADRLIASQKVELERRQEQLLAAVEEANRANRAKTEFFSNMSHDIRTPMNAIVGFSKLAIEEIDDREHLKDYLQRIEASSDHLLNLINDILDMSRIESGKMELTNSDVSLKKLISECADMINGKMDESGINFIVDIDDVGEDIVECDKLRFKQVMINLLSNAYKFTPEGGTVSVSAKLLKRAENLTYEISVSDTGIGMSEKFLEHIWDAFSREKNETVHKIQGTGLGMVIVKKIIDMMSGNITVRSKKGEGSEFTIILSLFPAKTDKEKLISEKKAESESKKDYSGKNILVVDDTPFNLVLVKRLLEKYGFNVITVDNGADAIKHLEEAGPGGTDLILMDVMMPVMDGIETTRKIRALEDAGLSGVPIVAMTANAFETDVRNVLDAGMNAHIAKPISVDKLISAIDQNLK